MIKNYSKISPTAVFCARMRAKQNVPFSKKIINLIDKKYKSKIKDISDYGNTLSKNNNFIPFIEGRYYSLSSAIEDFEGSFIVEIASGLSPRSFEFCRNKEVVYLDTDISKIIKFKEKILLDLCSKTKLKLRNIHFLAINPLNKGDMDKIGKLYIKYGKNKKLILIHEGLLMYLNKKEKILLRNNIAYFFHKYAKNGLWFSPDFSRLIDSDKIKKGKENIRDKISLITGRKFDYFRSEDEVKFFLSNGGFNYKILSNQKVIKNLIIKKKLLFLEREILLSSKGYRVWRISLAN